MKDVPLELRMVECKAVASADIQLNGLTVICGPNATGKSTIARTLRTMLETVLHYRGCRRGYVLSEYVRNVLSPLETSLMLYGDDLSNDYTWREREQRYRRSPVSTAEVSRHLDDIRTFLNESIGRFSEERLERFLRSRFCAQLKESVNLPKTAGMDELREGLVGSVEKLQHKIRLIDRERLLPRKLVGLPFDRSELWNGSVALREAGESFFAFDQDKVLAFEPSVAIENVIYIESPLVSQPSFGDGFCRMPGNVSATCGMEGDEDMYGLLSALGLVIKGSVAEKKVKRLRAEWEYRRNDGMSFDALECATGIKSFAILSRLFKHGLLNSKTVLIIDEPEAHLHPGWIVEYAAILVKLVEKMGVRVFVASHSPDMVNALQTFALCRNLSMAAAFYQAESMGRKDPYRFKFKPLNLQVDKIFDSFNTAYSLIEKKAQQLRRER